MIFEYESLDRDCVDSDVNFDFAGECVDFCLVCDFDFDLDCVDFGFVCNFDFDDVLFVIESIFLFVVESIDGEVIQSLCIVLSCLEEESTYFDVISSSFIFESLSNCSFSLPPFFVIVVKDFINVVKV